MGYKGKESKGFIVYKAVRMPVLGSEAYDLYFSVDKKSKREKDISNVTMMISMGSDDFVTEKSDPGLIQNVKTYLDNLHNMVSIYDHHQQIAEQEEVVKKLEKKVSGLSDDAEDLLKKKKKLEKEIEENFKEQADQQKELEKQRHALSALRGTNG
jgi:predicted RNase H-like nuclease (RuvC/YqgF family)